MFVANRKVSYLGTSCFPCWREKNIWTGVPEERLCVSTSTTSNAQTHTTSAKDKYVAPFVSCFSHFTLISAFSQERGYSLPPVQDAGSSVSHAPSFKRENTFHSRSEIRSWWSISWASNLDSRWGAPRCPALPVPWSFWKYSYLHFLLIQVCHLNKSTKTISGKLNFPKKYFHHL